MDVVVAPLSSVLPGFPPGAIVAGVVCLGLQIVLWVLFSYVLPRGPWRAEPGFTAHQCVALPVVCYLGVVGLRAWTSTPLAGYETAFDRATVPHETGSHLMHVVLGEIVLWDTPTGLAVRSLRQPAMIAHHVVMGILAYMGVRHSFCPYYSMVFFGLIELSSVPLALVDLTHPRHRAWVDYVKGKPVLEAVQLLSRALFALLYFVVRLGVYPYYMHFSEHAFFRDVVALHAMKDPPLPAPALVAIGVLAIFITLLQVYWGRLIARQVWKQISSSSSSSPRLQHAAAATTTKAD
ncbi:hypothetical protein CTAYLR_009482 [Chrysophaeum taylorii]|uniref:TLC domain-containing protein n=1 Tax=Chrysophaeum taylorii TaxID=2483200 RepID=A0AAD7UIG6_9STRA|nr:hypothetical protein CTAYLR_009482 [Chrysophaeum taylorii]